MIIMFVCLCKGVTEAQILEAIENGARSFREVRKELPLATQCCKCVPHARAVVDKALSAQTAPEPMYYSIY